MRKFLSIILACTLSFGWHFSVPEKAQASGTVWLVAIGGGASGGRSQSAGHRIGPGGGGAGEYYENIAFPISAGSTTVTIGAGGASVTDTTGQDGNEGATTTFGSLSVNGGGGGGYHSDVESGDGPGQNGGSGGGATNGGLVGNLFIGGSSTPTGGGVGFDGGSSQQDGGAGGGGAGARGANPTNVNGAQGGTGVTSSITGSAVCRAGGGGGGSYTGTGGTAFCGGGAGGNNNSAGTAATANTGAGGGGGGGTNGGSLTINSGAGGSGVVIVAYAKDGSDGVATSTGGTITSTATHWVHTFTTSGTFFAVLETEATTTSQTSMQGDVLFSGDLIIQ